MLKVGAEMEFDVQCPNQPPAGHSTSLWDPTSWTHPMSSPSPSSNTTYNMSPHMCSHLSSGSQGNVPRRQNQLAQIIATRSTSTPRQNQASWIFAPNPRHHLTSDGLSIPLLPDLNATLWNDTKAQGFKRNVEIIDLDVPKRVRQRIREEPSSVTMTYQQQGTDIVIMKAEGKNRGFDLNKTPEENIAGLMDEEHLIRTARICNYVRSVGNNQIARGNLAKLLSEEKRRIGDVNTC